MTMPITKDYLYNLQLVFAIIMYHSCNESMATKCLFQVNNHLPVLQVLNVKEEELLSSEVIEVEEVENVSSVKDELFSSEEGTITLGSDLEIISSNNIDSQETDYSIIADVRVELDILCMLFVDK